jgi:hypothetical protein
MVARVTFAMLKVCLDLLEALDKVDPGYSQLRGKYMGNVFSRKKTPTNVVVTIV